jgi:hypothetical protein
MTFFFLGFFCYLLYCLFIYFLELFWGQGGSDFSDKSCCFFRNFFWKNVFLVLNRLNLLKLGVKSTNFRYHKIERKTLEGQGFFKKMV